MGLRVKGQKNTWKQDMKNPAYAAAYNAAAEAAGTEAFYQLIAECERIRTQLHPNNN